MPLSGVHAGCVCPWAEALSPLCICQACPRQPYLVASIRGMQSGLRTRAGPEHGHLHCYAGKLALQLGWCWGERVRLHGAVGLLCCRTVRLCCAWRRPACLQPRAEVAAEGLRHQAPQLCHSARRNHDLQYPLLFTWLPCRIYSSWMCCSRHTPAADLHLLEVIQGTPCMPATAVQHV